MVNVPKAPVRTGTAQLTRNGTRTRAVAFAKVALPATGRTLTARAAESAIQATTLHTQSTKTMLILRCSRLAEPAMDVAHNSARQDNMIEEHRFLGLSVKTTRKHLTT